MLERAERAGKARKDQTVNTLANPTVGSGCNVQSRGVAWLERRHRKIFGDSAQEESFATTGSSKEAPE